MKFANMIMNFERESSRQRNYGDDIQLLAIENLYKYMNIDYENVIRIKTTDIFSYDGEQVILPINYPFYGCYPDLSPKIIPVFLGVSILSGKAGKSLHFSSAQPIGCRDLHTYKEIKKYGYNAYLNGCMTLTFPRRNNPGSGQIFFVDVCDELLPYVPKEMLDKAIFTSHLFYNKYATEDEAKAVYSRYIEHADLIVTSRLHCAVPCLAAGIPVIYACKKISFRSSWLENLIPLYHFDNFSEIDWYPKAIDLESVKIKMLNNAKTQVLNTYEKYLSANELNNLYKSVQPSDYYFESLENSFEYLNNNWKDKYKSYEYIIWGITQTAEILYDYIQEHYPNASLKGVIDVYRQCTFHNIPSCGMELLEDCKTATVFVAVESANKMALEIFEKYKLKNYVLCWKKLDYKL